MASSLLSQAITTGDLTDLVSSSTSATVYPSDDTILSVLQARFRSDLPYSRIGATNLVIVNPYKTLANVNDASAKDYEEKSYKDTSLPMPGASSSLPPHPYDLAARMYLLMRRRTETQSVVFRYVATRHCCVTVSSDESMKRHHGIGKDSKFATARQSAPEACFSFQKGG